MEEQQNANQSQTAKKPDKGALIIIGIIVAVILAVIIYFVVTSGNKGGNAVQPPADMGELRDVTPANLYGLWDKEIEAGTAQLDFKTDKTLVYKEMDKDGNVTAQSETGTFETQDGKLILTISAYGDTYSDLCTAYLSLDTLVISADEGTGFFNGTYKSESEIPDELYDYFNSETESETESDINVQPPVTDQQEVTTPETDAPVTEPPATESPATEPLTTEPPVTEPPATEPPATEPAVEYHVPKAAGDLLSSTAEQYFGGSVPAVNIDMIEGRATYEILYDSKHKANVVYNGTNIDYDTLKGNGTGYPIMITFDVQDIFPDLNSYTFEGLQEVLGDKVQYSLLDDPFGAGSSYDIWMELDGYVLHFNGDSYISSLDVEITNCVIRNEQQ